MSTDDVRFCVLAAAILIHQIVTTLWLQDLSADVRELKRRK